MMQRVIFNNCRCFFYFLLGSIAISFFVIFNPRACYSAHSSIVWNLSNQNEFFVGRETYLQKIDSFFKGKRHILALTGGPGFGKTQIAKKYAQTFYTNYDLIWLFDAQQDIPSQFERLSVALNTLLPVKDRITPSAMSKEALIDTVKNLLRIKNIRYLFIFDNPESYQQIEKFIPFVHHHQSGRHVLLTSRNGTIWTDALEIGKFKREESLQLIKIALPKENEQDRETLAATLGDYPLGLTIAIGFVKSCPTGTVSKYISLHIKRTLTSREDPPNMILDTYPNDAQTALLISLKAIEGKHKDALQALFFVSLLNSKDIPESYIELWLQKTGSPLTADEAIKYIYDQSLIGVSETTEFNANKKSEGQERVHYLSIHDLIHQLINETLAQEEKKKLLDAATSVLFEVFAGRSFDFIKRIIKEPIHLLHAKKLCKNAQAIGYTSSKLLQLKVCIFEFLMGSLRDFEGAKGVLEDIEKDRKQGLQLEPYYEALFKINKGFFESIYNANNEVAIRNMSEGLAILTSLKQYKEERLRAISNLAQYHALRGEINTAIEFINEGKTIFKKSTSEHYNCFYLFNWSFVLNDQGKFEESMDVLRQVKITPQFGADYPTLYHAILYQKIEILIKQRRLEDAQKNLREYEKIIKKFYKERYKTYVGLGNILYFKSVISLYKGIHTQKAIQYLSEAIKRYNETLRGDKKSRFQARTHLALGKIYAFKNDFTKALKAYLFSEDIYDHVLKDKRIDDVSDLYKELALLGIELKHDGLTHKYLKAHITFFGRSHPRTQEILHALDQKGLVVPF